MEPNGPDDGHAGKVPLMAVPPVSDRATLAWPWGLVAVGVMALAWVGLYLLWNGVAFLLN